MAPLIAALPAILSAAAPAIIEIIRTVERNMPPKSGPQKLETAALTAEALLKALSGAGVIPSTPQTDEVRAVVELLVQTLKSQGQLGGVTAPVATVPQVPASSLGQFTLEGIVTITAAK